MTASGHGRRFGTMRACFSTPLVSRPSPGETDRPLGAFRTPAARACGGLVTAGVRKPAQRRASHVPDPSPLAHISRRSRETRLPLEPAFSLESDLIQMPVSAGSFMERHRFGNSDLMISAIGLGCYGMSEVYGPADDAESIPTIRRALDLGVNFLDTSASYGAGHNHRLIGEAIRGRRHDVVTAARGKARSAGSCSLRLEACGACQPIC